MMLYLKLWMFWISQIINLIFVFYFFICRRMKRQPDTIYEDQAVCVSCWSSQKQEMPRAQENRSIPAGKDKKISLRKQTLTQRESRCNMPIRDIPTGQYLSKTARASTNPEITGNYHETAHLQHHTPITERPSYLSHPRSPPINFQDSFHKERIMNPSNCLLLTETTKMEKSIPILNEELIKTKKLIPPIRKGSTSLLHGKESVCSFTENYDPAQNIQESEVLQDYFNPTEAQLKQMKILYRIGHSRKN